MNNETRGSSEAICLPSPWARAIGMSLSEIEIRTPYVVAERLIVPLMLRFKPAKNVLSDTLVWCHRIIPRHQHPCLHSADDNPHEL
jgi:hypothetical protein